MNVKSVLVLEEMNVQLAKLAISEIFNTNHLPPITMILPTIFVSLNVQIINGMICVGSIEILVIPFVQSVILIALNVMEKLIMIVLNAASDISCMKVILVKIPELWETVLIISGEMIVIQKIPFVKLATGLVKVASVLKQIIVFHVQVATFLKKTLVSNVIKLVPTALALAPKDVIDVNQDIS